MNSFGMRGLGAGEEKVTVSAGQLTGKDIIDLVNTTMASATQAYKDYVAGDLMSKKVKNEKIVVPKEVAVQKGWTFGSQIALGTGLVIAVGLFAVFFLMKPKKKALAKTELVPTYVPLAKTELMPGMGV
jgi:hypothetical protein